MGEVVDGPTPYRVEVNQPFDRLPQCACDPGTGLTHAQQKVRIAELEAVLREIATMKGSPIGDTGFAVGPLSLFQACQRRARKALKTSKK